MKTREVDGESLLTTYDVGEILQVDPTSVNKWVREGRIPAFRTPGGHHRIKAADLVEFLKRHQMPVPPGLQKKSLPRLLVVDDEQRELNAIGRMLKPYAAVIDVEYASQGIDALVLVGHFQPDVVLLDVFMQGMDGVEVCRRLKAMDLTHGVKVILASAHMTPEIEAQGRAAGALRCVPKPVNLGDLLHVLGIETVGRTAAGSGLM